MSAAQGLSAPAATERVEVALLPAVGLSVATGGAFLLGSAGLLDSASPSGLPCVLAAATGIDCPFCGLTHGVAALGAGDLGAALAHNPLAPLAVALALAVAFALLRGRPLAVGWAATWALAALIAVVWLARVA